jgi:hypothetical protein
MKKASVILAWARGICLALVLALPAAKATAQGTISYGSPQSPIFKVRLDFH